MTISDATKTAFYSDKYITLKRLKGIIKIKPTNTDGNCIVIRCDGSYISKYGWQPSVEDLMSNEWLVVD